MNRRIGYRKYGVTLIEVAVSTALVGVVLVAALETLAGAMRTARETSDQLMANTLADDLLAEAIALPYADPENDASAIGLESDESLNAGDRTLFDDVDDFNGWKQTPPEDRDQQAIPGYTGWTRKVEVTYVVPTLVRDQLTTSNRDQGLKRILVSVIDPDGAVTTREAVRSPYGPNEAPAPFDATRVTTMEITLSVSGRSPVSKRVALTNLAEEP